MKEKTFSLTGAPCPATPGIDKQAAVAFESCTKCNCQMKADDSARLFEWTRAGKTLFVETRDSKSVTRGPFETRLRKLDKTHRADAAASTPGR